MKKIIAFGVASAVLSGLAGCSGSTDPATAGLFDNIRNMNNGTYDRQIASNEAERQSLLRQSAQQKRDIAAKRGAVQQNRTTIAQLRSEVAALSARISALRPGAANDPQKIASLDAANARLIQVRQGIDSGQDPASLRSELASVRASINALSR